MFINLVKKRYSLREYSNKPVDQKLILDCINAARLAPSACNSQPWHFIIINNENLLKKISQSSGLALSKLNKFVDQAPVIIAVIAEKPKLTAQIGGILKNKPFYLIDIGIAIEHFCLEATEKGLGTCILGWFNEKKIKKLLKIPRNKMLALLITAGYPEIETIKTKNRKKIESIYSINTYS